jgi:hypothetical protein
MHMVTISIAALVGAFAGGLLFGFGVHVGQQLPPDRVGYIAQYGHHTHPHPNQAGNQHQKASTP